MQSTISREAILKLANTINEEDEINEANAAHKSVTARSSNNLD